MFTRAQEIFVKLKMLVYGSYGTGKTPIALQFPQPVLLDLEKGSMFYGKCYDFDVAHLQSFDQCKEAIAFLHYHKKKHQTVVIDSLSHAWLLCQEKWMEKLGKQNKKGIEQISKLEWAPVKKDWNHFIKQIINLDMHVVCTAREKKNDAGETMLSCESNIGYYFDLVVYLKNEEKGTVATVVRDRTMSGLPGQFYAEYKVFETIFKNPTIATRENIEKRLREDESWIDEKTSFPYDGTWKDFALDNVENTIHPNTKGNIRSSAYLHYMENENKNQCKEETKIKCSIVLEKFKAERRAKIEKEKEEQDELFEKEKKETEKNQHRDPAAATA